MQEKAGLRVNGKKNFTSNERATNVTFDLRSYYFLFTTVNSRVFQQLQWSRG